MECRYCQATNGEDDHRCGRCGRRLRAMPAMTPAYNSAATAPALRYEEVTASAPSIADRVGVAIEPAPPPLVRKPITYQPSLFSSRELPRVVPFETIAPSTLEPTPRKATVARPRPRQRRVIPGQQNLEFTPAAGSGRHSRAAENTIYCDAPVAVAAHRALAAAMDASMIVISLVIFGAVFYFAGGSIALNAKTLPIVLASALLVTLFYKALWCFANGDSAGMKWARLTLVDFDGQRPDRKQRFQRMTSGFVSLFAAGLGLVWALVDEETLTWHDHISRTFPTPY